MQLVSPSSYYKPQGHCKLTQSIKKPEGRQAQGGEAATRIVYCLQKSVISDEGHGEHIRTSSYNCKSYTSRSTMSVLHCFLEITLKIKQYFNNCIFDMISWFGKKREGKN